MVAVSAQAAPLRVLRGSEGGTGTSTAAAGDVGKCLSVLTANPLTFNYATCSGAGSTANWFVGTGYGAATSSTLGFTNGFLSSASSTISSSLRLSTLTSGVLGVGTDGLVYKTGTSSPTFGSEFSYTGTTGYFLNGTDGTLSLAAGGIALTKLAVQSANTVLVNQTSGNASPTALATSTFALGLYGFGSNGQQLTWNNGVPGWTSTSSPTSPITWTPAGGYSCATCLTANQTITLSGVVTGSGATSIVTAFGTMAQGVLTNPASAATIPTANATTTLYGPAFTALTTNYFVGVGSTTPWAQFSINPTGFGNGAPMFAIGSTSTTTLVVSSAGLTGFGTTTPTAVVAINPIVDNGVRPPFLIGSTTGGTSFIVSNNSRVGVGTSSPGSLFSVQGVANFNTATTSFIVGLDTTRVRTTAASTLNGLVLSNITGSAQCLHVDANGTITGTGADCSSATGNSKWATSTSAVYNNAIYANGGTATIVGIGTTTPAFGLQIASSTGPQLALSGTGLATSTWTFRATDAGYLYISTSSPGFMNGIRYATTTATNALTIAPNGNVGLGTSSPVAGLHIYDTTSNGVGRASILIGGNDAGDTDYWMGRSGNNDSTSNDLFLWGTGNIVGSNVVMSLDGVKLQQGIGTSTPWATLSVNPTATNTGPQFVVGSSTMTSLMVSNTNLIGIGTTSPWALLSVNGDAFLNGKPLFSVGSTSTTTLTITNAGYTGFGTTTPWAQLSINPTADNGAKPQFVIGSSTMTNFLVANSGLIGIGTSTPWSRFTLDRNLGLASSSITVAQYSPATSTAQVIDCRDSNTIHVSIGTSATTITLKNMVGGQGCKVWISNPSTTAGTITWATSGQELYWTGGTIPTQTTTANKRDLWSFTADQIPSGATTTPKTTVNGAATLNF